MLHMDNNDVVSQQWKHKENDADQQQNALSVVELNYLLMGLDDALYNFGVPFESFQYLHQLNQQ